MFIVKIVIHKIFSRKVPFWRNISNFKLLPILNKLKRISSTANFYILYCSLSWYEIKLDKEWLSFVWIKDETLFSMLFLGYFLLYFNISVSYGKFWSFFLLKTSWKFKYVEKMPTMSITWTKENFIWDFERLFVF